MGAGRWSMAFLALDGCTQKSRCNPPAPACIADRQQCRNFRSYTPCPGLFPARAF